MAVASAVRNFMWHNSFRCVVSPRNEWTMTDRSAGMSLLSRIAVIGGAVTCFLGAFELTARVEDLVQYGVPIRSPFNATSELLVRSPDGMHGRRSAAFQKWRMNGLGFRGPEVDSAKAPGRLRVITAGASETFGLYEAPGKEWPRQLEDSLRRRLAGSACGRDGVEVWNAAFAGMSLPTIRQDIERRLVRFSPDVIVVDSGRGEHGSHAAHHPWRAGDVVDRRQPTWQMPEKHLLVDMADFSRPGPLRFRQPGHVSDELVIRV